ncbi:hypothetical protein HRD49_20395 [Corallococcus exiguus]|uniref:hypothetical protein n=1 Tax=Corallococcus exiguus TaxID=83462 RepID=UPI0015619F60|nr:hypothetical protein [Corallococcus exiguus]NRD64117.1 hypothetical protein [Corallococcus exiguus]
MHRSGLARSLAPFRCAVFQSGAHFERPARTARVVVPSKAKLFGIHTEMYSLGGLGDHLTGGDRVTFRWIRD